jgi:hypothetical protein
MKTTHWFVFGALLAGLLLAGPVRAQDDDAVLAAEADEPEGVEVLTRGPIHEAFATPVTGELKPTLVIPKEPPANIDEVPPDFRPEGDDVAWIPGYWSWDDEREDFIWISGVWRRTPPNQRWVPGYWDKVDDGWRWSQGFWAPIAEEAITYYDPPPETLEAGPNSDPPGDNYFWTPGVWTYQQTDYRWRPGYWAQSQPNWIWMPDRWVWTPSGAVFCAGFWDYTFASRGCVFSPVYINRSVYVQPGFSWRPRYTLNPAALLVNFWIRPNYCHYYFGNYYGGNYGRWGYTPMSQYYGRRGGWGWDPIIAYNQAHYRGRGINYVNRMNSWHQFYVDHPNRRPPATWRDQVNIVKNQKITVNKITNITNVNNIVNNDVDVIAGGNANVVALPINQVAKARRHDPDLRMARVDDAQREQARHRAKQFHQINAERSKAERQNDLAVRDRDIRRDDSKKVQVRNKVTLPAVATAGNDQPGRDKPDRDERPGRDKPMARDDRPGRDAPARRDRDDAGRDDRPRQADRPATDKPDRTPRNRSENKPDRSGDKPDKPRYVVDPPAPRQDRPKTDGTPPNRPDNKPDRSGDKPDKPKYVVDPPAPRRDRPKTDGTAPNRPENKPDRTGDKPDKPRYVVDPPASSFNRPKTDRPDRKPNRSNDAKSEKPSLGVDPPASRTNRPKTDRPNPERKPEPRRVEKPAVRPEPRPQPRSEARPRPQPEPRPQPRVESRPQPKPVARPQPAARPHPRVESRPNPNPAARPQPRIDSPRPPKNSGGGRTDVAGRGKDKDKKDKK